MKRRSIGIITTSRADYGIYSPVMAELSKHSDIEYFLYVSGTHLLKDFGNTIDLIKKDGHPIANKIRIKMDSSSSSAITHTMSRYIEEFGKSFKTVKPDILLVLGDRYEMFSAVSAAVPFNIPIAHIHGGEVTIGAMDEVFRHAITKMSHIHFVATETASKRVVAMGEDPKNVHVSGAPGLDNLNNIKLLSREKLKQDFNIPEKDFLIAAFHPVTREYQNAKTYIDSLLKALDNVKIPFVFTGVNADTNAEIIKKRVIEYISGTDNGSVFVENLGTQAYFSVMKEATAMVGNSSSGIIEAASFKLPVVNIGTRQGGREQSANVINSGYDSSEIESAISKAISQDFKNNIQSIKNVYGNGAASEKIVKILREVDLDKITSKSFHMVN